MFKIIKSITWFLYNFIISLAPTGKKVSLLKPPHSPHCYLGAVDHSKKFPPTPGHTASQVLSHFSGHSDPFVLKFLWSCSGVSQKWNLLKTWVDWKVTLELAFPAHCISNWKLNGISKSIISKVALNAANERARCSRTPRWARRWGKIVQWSMKAWSRKPRRGDLCMISNPDMP